MLLPGLASKASLHPVAIAHLSPDTSSLLDTGLRMCHKGEVQVLVDFP
jgi:hypothetical protein